MADKEGEEKFKGWEWADKPPGKVGRGRVMWLSRIWEHALGFSRSLKIRSSALSERARELEGKAVYTGQDISRISDTPKSGKVEGRKGLGSKERSSKHGTFKGIIKRFNSLKRSLPLLLALAGTISLLLSLLPVTVPITKRIVEPNTYEIIPCIDGMMIKSDGELCYDLKRISFHPATFKVRFPVIKGNGNLTVRVDNGYTSENLEYELVDSGYVIPVAEGMYNVTVTGTYRIYDALLKPAPGKLVETGDGMRAICSSDTYLIAGNPMGETARISIYRKSYDILRFLIAISLLASALVIKSRLKRSDIKD